MSILITGGTGFIGSHTVVELIEAGETPIIVDNLSNSKEIVLDRIETITGKRPAFYKLDCKSKDALRTVFSAHKIDAIIHFAAFKAVGESVKKPLQYYRNNLDSTFSLLEVMEEFDCKKFIFSSSATVYGPNNPHPYKEEMPAIQSSSPYGWTKVMIERVLTDYVTAHPDFCAILLRYFNPIGAHKSGRIGEDPNGIPNNLVPYISQVAIGKLDHLNVNGNDYPTPDGTGVRDYIHVVDLALGHIKAVEKVLGENGCFTHNLGTGNGYSVLEVVKAFEKACGKPVKYVVAPRRPGDIATCYSDPTKAKEELDWVAEKGIDEMCADSYRWQHTNPNGYED